MFQYKYCNLLLYVILPVSVPICNHATSSLYTSSSVSATALCELWPVEQYLSIFPYLSPTLSIFSLPTLEDLLPLLLSILSWVFLFVSSLPVLEWRSFWASYSPPFSPGDPANLSFAPFIHFTIFSPLFNSSSSRFVLHFHSPSSYLAPYILLNIFLSKISTAHSSFFVIVHVSAPYVTTGLVNVVYNLILVALDKGLFLTSLYTTLHYCDQGSYMCRLCESTYVLDRAGTGTDSSNCGDIIGSGRKTWRFLS